MNARAILCCAALMLGGCVTTQSLPPGSERNLKEAARINAQLGIDYMRKGQFDVAEEKFLKALEQDDDLALAHSSIAYLYALKGKTKEAGSHYREALSQNANDPFTLNNYGVFLCGRGEVRDAEKYFLRAAELPQNNRPADSWANAGVCVRQSEKLEQAESYFRKALELDSRHPNALAQMAWLNFKREDFLRTRAFLQRYESVAPPTAETLWIGVRTERALGDSAAARVYERRLKSGFPDAPETYELFRESGR